jgi:hypothetical protein
MIKKYKKFINENASDVYKNTLKTLSNIPGLKISEFTVNEDGSVDVDGDVLFRQWINKIPVKFGVVKGNFHIIGTDIINLENSPKIVHGNFNCTHNNLTTLEGCPEYVGFDFDCSDNRLMNLVGSPKEVGGDFNCSESGLISLQGCSEIVGGEFICHRNKLTTLAHLPKKIGGRVFCKNNKILSLRGAEDKNIHFAYNPISILFDYFKIPTGGDNDKLDLFNDFDIIRYNVIVKDRLELFLKEIHGDDFNTYSKIEQIIDSVNKDCNKEYRVQYELK